MSPAEIEKHVFRSIKFQGVVEEAINFFVSTPVNPLLPKEKFDGAGVYALYYVGAFSDYKTLAQKNILECASPIYVGKAVPPGWRTARTQKTLSADLHRRLREHANSIKSTSNLKLTDFRCRFMVLENLEADLVVPIEAELIRRFTPIWNNLIDGFGNHDPGSGRYNQAKSEWDTLHPGRKWADRLKGRSPSLQNVEKKLRDAFK